MGAINLAILLETETKPEMREAVLGSLYSLIKNESFRAKREYIACLEGLNQLKDWIHLKDNLQVHKFGKGNLQRRNKTKLYELMWDLV